MINKGSNINYLEQLRNQALNITKNDISLNEALEMIATELNESTKEFIDGKNKYDVNYISAVSMCIYLPDFENGEYKLRLISGSKTRNEDIRINEETMFDVASITKLYTLILLFKLEELGFINLEEKICNINPDFQNLEDFTLNDLVRLHGELKTDGNIKLANSSFEAYEILKTLYLSSNDRTENKYTDFGAMVISDTICKVLSKHFGYNLTFEEIMEKYLLNPIKAKNTLFNPTTNNVTGNGNELGLVHDPKARILGSALGHAGIFTTSDDLARLAKEIYKVNYYNKGLISKKSLNRLGEVTFPNSKQSNKGNLGIYVKHPLGYEKTFTPPEFSRGSFSHQGWTGSLAMFDPNNYIHNNILVNAIYEDNDSDKVKNDKAFGFMGAFETYQMQVIKKTMLMYVVKKYYNKYCNVNDNVDIVKHI